jgi:hypothetical protein
VVEWLGHLAPPLQVREAAARLGAACINMQKVWAVRHDCLDAAARQGEKVVHPMFYAYDGRLPRSVGTQPHDLRKARENQGNQGRSDPTSPHPEDERRQLPPQAVQGAPARCRGHRAAYPSRRMTDHRHHRQFTRQPVLTCESTKNPTAQLIWQIVLAFSNVPENWESVQNARHGRTKCSRLVPHARRQIGHIHECLCLHLLAYPCLLLGCHRIKKAIP